MMMALLPLETSEPKDPLSKDDLAQIDLKKVPQHIAIVMDGNRRWAKAKKLRSIIGHWEGAEVLTDIVKASAQLGVKTLTVYAFSTENWNRSREEIESLMSIFELYLVRKREMLVNEGVCLNTIGDISKIPQSVQEALRQTCQATKNGKRINLVLAINYGGRDEICRAIGKMLARHEEKKITKEELTEEFVSQYLDTQKWGDPQLLIRTSGEMRVSNFLLWQISYSEFYVTDVLWPSFTAKELLKAVVAYQSRQRRLGGGA